MLLIEVNNKHYKFYNEWRDVTIKQMMRWAQTDIPKCLVEAIDAMGDMVEVDGEKKAAGITGYFKHIEKLTPDERRKEIPRYIGVMLEAFTDIPPDVIAKINDADRTSFFHDYLIIKLLDVRLMTKLQLQDIAKFEFNGKTYHLPKIGKAINADSKGIDLMAVEFAESSDIAANADKLQGGNLEALPYLLALLCKEDGEQYDEQNVMKKAQEFEGLDMQTAWEVYFFMRKCLRILQEGIRDFSKTQQLTLQQRLRQKNLESMRQAGRGKS